MLLVSRAVIPHMQRQGGGAIVNTGSTASLVGEPNLVSYDATKGAVLQLTRQMAIDFAKDGIRVNCICPGWIDTGFNDPIFDDAGMSPQEIDDAVKLAIPMNRQGTAADVAPSVAFLFSDDAVLHHRDNARDRRGLRGSVIGRGRPKPSRFPNGRRTYGARLPQQACTTSLWSQKVGSASAAVITSTPRRDASSPPPSSLMTSRVGIHHLAQGDPPRTTSVEPSVRMLLEPTALEYGRQLLAKRLVVATRSPPVAVSPDPLIVVVARVRGINGSGSSPIAILVEQPPSGAQALRHSPDRLLLDAFEMKQHQPRTDEVERRPKQVERVVEDAVLDHLEIRDVQPRQVAGVDVSRDNMTRRPHLLGQPHRHRAAPCPDLQTPQSRLNH